METSNLIIPLHRLVIRTGDAGKLWKGKREGEVVVEETQKRLTIEGERCREATWEDRWDTSVCGTKWKLRYLGSMVIPIDYSFSYMQIISFLFFFPSTLLFVYRIDAFNHSSGICYTIIYLYDKASKNFWLRRTNIINRN